MPARIGCSTPACAVRSMWQLIEREELWALRIDLLEPRGWATRGILRGTGPLVVKDRVVVLDTSGIPGTTRSTAPLQGDLYSRRRVVRGR